MFIFQKYENYRKDKKNCSSYIYNQSHISLIELIQQITNITRKIKKYIS